MRKKSFTPLETIGRRQKATVSLTGFTLVEILIVIVVIGILVTIAVPNYQNVIEAQKEKVCETNLKALQIGLNVYAMEHDTIPGTISQIPAEYINKAYTKILQQKDAWKIKLAYFIIGLEKRNMAYAQVALDRLSIKDDLAKGNRALIICPKDPNPDASHGSYGIYSGLANKSSQDYQNLSSDTVLIGDCKNATFNTPAELTPRHKRYHILGTVESHALGIKKVTRDKSNIEKVSFTSQVKAKK